MNPKKQTKATPETRDNINRLKTGPHPQAEEWILVLNNWGVSRATEGLGHDMSVHRVILTYIIYSGEPMK